MRARFLTRVRSIAAGEELRFIVAGYGVVLSMFWLYFRIDDRMPILLDIMILPALSLFSIMLMNRVFHKRFWPGLAQSSLPPQQVRICRAMCITGAPFYWVLWIYKRHVDNIPDEIMALLFLIAVPAFVVSCVFACVFTVMQIQSRGRKHMSGTAETN